MHSSFVLASGGSGGVFNGGSGGVHDTDGASGSGAGGGAGGLAGTSSDPDGEIGMDSSDTASGGGGGGGGYTANDPAGTATIDNVGTLTGGAGGAGGASIAGAGNGAGGGGGEGGFGAIVTGSGMTSTNGDPMAPLAPAFIIGGNGGAGGASNTTNAQSGSGGGDGGFGVRFTDVNVTFINYSGGVVVAGNGGIGGSISNSTNPNSIGGAGGYGGVAVQFDGANATLFNDGSITGGSGAAGTASSNTGGDGGIGADGARFDGSGAVVVNTGAITGGDGASGGSGVDGGSGGNGGNGVEISNTGSVTNRGTITGGNAGAGGSGTSSDGADGNPGIGLLTNGSSTIINSGAIVGGINLQTLQRAASVRMSSGTNVLEIQAGYSFTGNVIGLGSDTLRFGGSTDAAFNLSSIGMAAQFQQFESLAKNGTSSWTLTGTTPFNGSTTITAGSLFVNGSLSSSPITVNGGVLGGNGTVGAITASSGASVDPGAAANSVGTLTSTGAFSTMSGSTLHIDASSSANDRLIANSAALNGNGTVVVHRLSGLLTANQQYVFLTTSAGAPLGGANVFAGITDDLPRIDLLLGYTANSAYFYFVGSGVNFATVAQTPNELAVANYLDQTVAGASGDYRTVLEQLDRLNADELRAAYNQLSGEAHATAGQTTINTTTLMLLQVGNHLGAMSMNGSGGGFVGNNLMAQVSPAAYPSASPDSASNIQLVRHTEAATAETMVAESCALCCDCSENQRLWNAWSAGYGLGGSAQSDGNASGASYGVGGFLAGVDRWIDDSTLVGVFGGYLGSGFSTGVPSANVHDNAGQGGLYALRRGDVLYVSGLIGGQSDQYTSHRNINFGTIQRTATGNYDGWQGFGYSELGANFSIPGWHRHSCLCQNKLSLQPYGALQYVHLRQNSISETGAGSLNLATAGFDTDSLRSFLGARLRYDNHGENNLRRIVPELQASWLHEYIDARSAFNARFGAVGGNGFNTQGLNVGRDWALLGAGLTYVVNDNIRLAANYYAQTNDRQTYHVGAGGLNILW